MPIYEYQCQACGALTEALQKLSDPPLTRCPACGQEALRKKVSAAAFRLKGSGWYETDFKTGNKKNLAGEGDGKPAGDGKADGAAGGGKDAAKEGRKDGAKDGKKEARTEGGTAKAADRSKGGSGSSAA
jgi:putative FmdB family regulatory protein